MTPETIERLALEAGIEFERDIVQVLHDPVPSSGGHGCTISRPVKPATLSALVRFAALVRAQEHVGKVSYAKPPFDQALLGGVTHFNTSGVYCTAVGYQSAPDFTSTPEGQRKNIP